MIFVGRGRTAGDAKILPGGDTGQREATGVEMSDAS